MYTKHLALYLEHSNTHKITIIILWLPFLWGSVIFLHTLIPNYLYDCNVGLHVILSFGPGCRISYSDAVHWCTVSYWCCVSNWNLFFWISPDRIRSSCIHSSIPKQHIICVGLFGFLSSTTVKGRRGKEKLYCGPPDKKQPELFWYFGILLLILKSI